MNEKLKFYFSENIRKNLKSPSHSFEKIEEFQKLSINNLQGSTATCKKQLIFNFKKYS